MSDKKTPTRRGRPRKTDEPNPEQTPAHNAGSDVIVEAKPGFLKKAIEDASVGFYERLSKAIDEPEQLDGVWLPEVPGPERNRIGVLAEVFHASGYFGELTPAQIAVQMLAGEWLELTPVQAMFDLKIDQGEDGPTIGYRKSANIDRPATPETESRARAADVLPFAKAPADTPDKLCPACHGSIGEGKITAQGFEVCVGCWQCGVVFERDSAYGGFRNDPPEPENANKGDLSVQDEKRPGYGEQNPETPASEQEPGKATLKTDDRRSKIDDPLPKTLGDMITVKQVSLMKGFEAEGYDVEAESQFMFNTAWKDLSRNAAAELYDALVAIRDGKVAPIVPPNWTNAADNAENGDTAGSAAWAALIGDNAVEDVAISDVPIDPGPGPVLENDPRFPVDPTPGPDAGAVGDETNAIVAGWRSRLIEICNELGINPDEKTATFDASNLSAKRKMFETSTEYYKTKLAEVQKFVLDSLAADGKDNIDKQKGFFIYAEVDPDPESWSYSEAKQAQNALKDYLTTKPAAGV